MLLRIFCALLVALVLASCDWTRKVVTPHDEIIFHADEIINPDPRGRAAPLTVRVYELTARGAFDYMDYDAIVSNGEVILGDQLLSAHERVILPKESQSLRINLNERAKFIGIVASYRDIDQARWKLVYPVNANWIQTHDVHVTDNAIKLKEQ